MDSTNIDLVPKIVLGISAHPDDLDYGAGGTIAKFISQGAKVYYLILTDGSKGISDSAANAEEVANRRVAEQQEASTQLGLSGVIFAGFEDAKLANTEVVKREIIRRIREYRPDTVITHDPTFIYSAELGFINHPDHRAAGQAALDAVYPLARDAMSYPELLKEGLEPHEVSTILLMRPDTKNFISDISDFIEQKRLALAAHTSQPNVSNAIVQTTEYFVLIKVEIS
jgi:LmbE family N-acetylglucosaminyl deacetylase